MLGLSGPSDYSQEPSRHPCLHINAKASFSFVLLCHSLIGVSSSKPLTSLVQEPFNAEPPRSALVSSYVTPVELFFKRNHGPIPLVDDIERYCVDISGNRRTAMSITRKVKGVGWDVSAIGNAVWGGAKLADILELLGVPKLTSSTQSGGKHIEFVSIDKCQVEENGGPYKASIPLSQATNPEADVLLAYEMNGEPLNRDHGYPLRVIVPGVIGARSVKWLDSINIIAEECQGFFMQKDYKMFPPSVDWGNINWNTRKPQMDFPVQSVICSLEDVQSIKPGKVRISGYAVSGGGRGIERVDVSIDGGKTWMEATRFQKTGIPYIADGISNDKWAWVLFELTVDIPQSTEIIAKAVDSAANVQPEKVQDIWNLRGILNTSWHRVHVRVGHSNM
ncbi:Sulfite oxidase [Gossypium australe]|uniref:Sulfite oxidase n=1 Tax=Gossypium australe TaxID=47621 RepID=A0A5B6UTP6_9ROSI|nr:Sulfite oxidase [Gossypium australe]